MSTPLIATRVLFRFELPCFAREPIWSPAGGAALDESYRLVDLSAVEVERTPQFADVRAGWSPAGLSFAVEVRGKRQPVWCREGRPDESDGLRLWIDTRDTHNIHRASRFCHQFVFLPSGAGQRMEEPLGSPLPIHRAKEHPKLVTTGSLPVRCQMRRDGYTLEAHLPAATLTGYDPAEHPRLGFNYAIVDRELGTQTLASGPGLPYDEDPSLWATLELAARSPAQE